jgi:hypothetical protein
MPNSAKAAAFAAFTEQMSQDRAARIAREVSAVQPAAAEQQTTRLPDLFADAFGHQSEVKHYAREATAPERPWDRALALAADDDAPRPPGPAGEPAPAAVPPVAEPSPQARRMGSAEELFDEMEQRLSATVEVTELPPDVQLRRAFRELPGGQREAIAKLIEAQDFGLPGYFDSRNFGPDYVAVLVSSALARRFADAQRLQPDLSPAALLEQITAAAG